MGAIQINFHETTIKDLIAMLNEVENKDCVITDFVDRSLLKYQLSWGIGRVVKKGYSDDENNKYLIVAENATKWILHDGSTVSKKTHNSPGPIYSSWEYFPLDEFVEEKHRESWIEAHKPDLNIPDEHGFAIGVKVRRMIGCGLWSSKSPEWDDFNVVATITGSKGNYWKLSNGVSIDKVDHYEHGTNKRVWYVVETEATKASFEAQQVRKSIKCCGCGKLFNPNLPGNSRYEEFERYDHGTPWGVMSHIYNVCPHCGAKQNYSDPEDTGKNIPGTIAFAVEGR